MSGEGRPLPNVDPETEPFWKGAADGQFLLRRCTDCDLVYYYPRSRCPDCLGDAVEWVEAEGTGEVYSHTATELVSDWPEDDLPVVVAYVELAEGPRVLTNLVNCDPADVAVGTRVEVRFRETDRDDVGIPVFEPVPS